MPTEKLDWAMGQVERTLEKMEKENKISYKETLEYKVDQVLGQKMQYPSTHTVHLSNKN